MRAVSLTVLARFHQSKHPQGNNTMAIPGAPAALKIGGTTSSGPAAGIYHVKVADATTGLSSKKKTPYLELDFHVHNDPDNKAKEGKRLVKQRYYLAGDGADEDKVQTMKGMMKRGPFKGFEVPWPQGEKNLDPRVFVGKEAFVLLGLEKPRDESTEAADLRMEVKRIAKDKSVLEEAKDAGEVAEGTSKPAKAPASRR